jgi:ElaA protein
VAAPSQSIGEVISYLKHDNFNMLVWQFSRFEDIAPRDWYQVAAARIDVFIIEQNCPFQDLDGVDFFAWHLLGWSGDAERKQLAAYCRLVDAGVKFAEPSIGRVITTTAFRGKGAGIALMQEACRRHDAQCPSLPNRIGAQARLENFYRAFGFVTASAPYMEDGIPHLEMVRPAAVSLQQG